MLVPALALMAALSPASGGPAAAIPRRDFDQEMIAEDPTPPEVTPADPTPASWPFPNVPQPPSWPFCRVWYPDCDGDGHADPTAGMTLCWNPNWTLDPPACAWLRVGDDCDDAEAAIYPGAPEGPEDPPSQVDGIDNDCDGFTDIDCDGTSGLAAPRIALEAPSRGTFTTASSVQVSGVVLPGLGGDPILPVSVGGVSTQTTLCSGDGGVRFAASVPLLSGVTTIGVWATDEGGKSDEAETSVAQAASFIDLPSQRITSSLNAMLNQGSWSILGDTLEAYLDADELEAELMSQNPLIQDSGDDDCLESWELYGEATGYTHDDVQVDFVVTGGVIKTTARLIHPQIWATGWAAYDLEWYCGGWSDHVNLSAWGAFSQVVATADGRLSLDGNGQIHVSFGNVQVDAQGAEISVDADDSLYDWLIDLFEDDLADELESFVEDELAAYVSTDLGPDLEGEINDLDLSYTVDVEGIPYGVDFRYSDLTVMEGGVKLGFSMGTSYTTDPRIPTNPGAVHLPTTFTASVAPTFGFGVGLDFFNGALHGMWEGGSLHLTTPLSTDPPITGAAAPLLPPVIVPGASPWLLELRLGDVIAAMDVTQADGTVASFDAALSCRVPVTLEAYAAGTSLLFDVGFGPSEVSYDLLGADLLPQGLEAASEAAMAGLLDEMLLELEGYLEELELSYLGVPMVITDLSVHADPANPAMIDVDGQAVYAGP